MDGRYKLVLQKTTCTTRHIFDCESWLTWAVMQCTTKWPQEFQWNIKSTHGKIRCKLAKVIDKFWDPEFSIVGGATPTTIPATTSSVQSYGFGYDYYPPFWNQTCLYEVTKVKD
jgi:hypothetical protein